MARKALSQQEIYDLYQAARGGDTSALRALNETSSYFGKKANERLTDFEKAGMSSIAYQRAQHFIQEEQDSGTGRFKRGKKLDAYEAFKNASEARRFIRAKTGTVTRERKREAAVMEKLQKGGYLPENMTSAAKKDFTKFLRSNAWDEIKNTMGSQTMKEVAEAINEGNDINELLNAYEEYEAGDTEFFDFAEDWLNYDSD